MLYTKFTMNRIKTNLEWGHETWLMCFPNPIDTQYIDSAQFVQTKGCDMKGKFALGKKLFDGMNVPRLPGKTNRPTTK